MIDSEKNTIRKFIRSEKRKYSIDQKKDRSLNIFRQVEGMPLFQSSETIMAYWSMDDEVFTHDFILKYYKQKQIILPVVKGDTLVLKKFTGLSDLEKGEAYGINEPKGDVYEAIENIDMIIVPGVAFDNNNNRLGRGKAYYDKLLKESKSYKVGVCFDFQLIEEVPVDEYDIKMDLIISES